MKSFIILRTSIISQTGGTLRSSSVSIYKLKVLERFKAMHRLMMWDTKADCIAEEVQQGHLTVDLIRFKVQPNSWNADVQEGHPCCYFSPSSIPFHLL
ncbi:hypothetical protein GOP47_0027405 [Adiantum capillus-veneris]|nr:hypothetical protein GOP47_0027405 [Adiantum capillus-veneris]